MVCVAQRAQPGSSEWSGRVKCYWTEFSCHCWWQVCVTHTRRRRVFHWLPCAHTSADGDGWRTATEQDDSWCCFDLFCWIHRINIILYQLYCQWASLWVDLIHQLWFREETVCVLFYSHHEEHKGNKTPFWQKIMVCCGTSFLNLKTLKPPSCHISLYQLGHRLGCLNAAQSNNFNWNNNIFR